MTVLTMAVVGVIVAVIVAALVVVRSAAVIMPFKFMCVPVAHETCVTGSG